LRSDANYLWLDGAIAVDVDFEKQENALHQALEMEPGVARDATIMTALDEGGELLENENSPEWAVYPRDRLNALRQEARLELARDRARGKGHSRLVSVIEAWEGCAVHDPTCEEAAAALMRAYLGQGRRHLAASTYERCRDALAGLGLRVSPALEEVYRTTSETSGRRKGAPGPSQSTERQSTERQLPGRKEERRLVSIIFAELSGPVGAGLGPEELRDVVARALSAVITEVEGLGGAVTAVSGSGLSAMFGAPEAHEDDPERAVRAGFRVVSAVGQSGAAEGHHLSIRAGVETGPAVVGPLGYGAQPSYCPVGEVVGVAAALQSVAKAGMVLVGPATRAATEDVFVWGPTDEVVVAEGAKPLSCSYLERPVARSPGYRGHHPAVHARLVGRQRELGLFTDALRDCLSGTGSLVFVVGEPGLGKTRLVQECRKRFLAWVGAGTGRLPLWLEGRCASYASSTPYGLYQQLMSSWIGVAPEEGEDAVRQALDRAMRAVFGRHDSNAGFLAQMMGLRPGAGEADAVNLSPEGLQRATFAAMRALMGRLVERGPTVLVLEDLHWCDPTSLRLTEELAGLVQAAPLLLLATRRPEPDRGASELESSVAGSGCAVRSLDLEPLVEADERELARRLTGGAPEQVLAAVCAGVEGNPLFMEERLASLLETGALQKDGDVWRLGGAGGNVVPEVLERLIRSRVDRLPARPREVIATASVLGAEFALSDLGAVSELNGETEGAVGQLCAAGLVQLVREVPERVYRFRHALIQEATYRGMVKADRQQTHARAAWRLEEVAGDRLEEVAAVLGGHFAAAGELERAAHYQELAGDHATKAFANEEAITSYRQALSIADQRPALGGAAVELRHKLAQVLYVTGRHAEAVEILGEALSLVGADDAFRAARLQALLGRVQVHDHHYDAALAAFDAADELLGDHPEQRDQEVVDLWLEVQIDGRAYLLYWSNQPDKGAAVLERARPVLEARGSPTRKTVFYSNSAMQKARQSRYRIDGSILADVRRAVAESRQSVNIQDASFAAFLLGFCLLWQGDLAESRDWLEAALADAERSGQAVLRARCLCYLNVNSLRSHDVEGVRSMSPRALGAGEAAGFPEYVAAAMACMAWVAWKDGDHQKTGSLLESVVVAWDAGDRDIAAVELAKALALAEQLAYV
jgi:predicted ATPase/class 3 adenylate cyclase